jgi:tetratricopeptide (TPR) repeat protein
VGEHGAYQMVKGLADIQVPLTVQAILAARIDRLSPEDKRLLQSAAVIGKDVPIPLLLAIADAPEHEVRAQLTHLQAAEFLYETRLFPDLVYTFKHALTLEVAYGGLLHDRQRALHARITDALERLSTERVAEQAERLAHHALRGELWERAVAYLRQVGLRAMARAANSEAIAYLEQALGALRRLSETRETTELTIDIRLDLRNALNPLGDRARMGEHLHEAEVLARTLGDQHRLARIATFMANQCVFTGEYDEAIRFGQEALSIARTLGDRSIEVAATSFLGQTHIARGEFSDAAAFLERNVVALEGDLRYERFGTPFIQSAFSEAWLADALSQLGRFEEAIVHAEAAVRIAEAADHPWTLHQGLFDLGRAHLRRGDLPRATRVLERGLDVCRTWQFVEGIPFLAAALGAAYALAGRADEAIPLVAGAVEEFRRRQLHARPALILLCAGITCLSAGRIDEAASHAREALALTRRLGARGSEAHALCLAGDVALTGAADDAPGYYREALALAGELGMRPLVAHCHLGLGKLYRRTGKSEQTHEHLTIATTMYREMDMRFWLEQAEAELRRP